tara:strand:+ start:219 stop:614 length:396 start_codon:yes stop_codon:yes gene_type:complete
MDKTVDSKILNVLGEPLEMCSCGPITGWYRDGFCKTDLSDIGQHTICCVMNESFLSYSKAQGNDLITPKPNYDFPGLKPGDHWCLCAPRWRQAYEDGMAPLVRLKATEIGALGIIGIELLMEHTFKSQETI